MVVLELFFFNRDIATSNTLLSLNISYFDPDRDEIKTVILKSTKLIFIFDRSKTVQPMSYFRASSVPLPLIDGHNCRC